MSALSIVPLESRAIELRGRRREGERGAGEAEEVREAGPEELDVGQGLCCREGRRG